MKRTREIGWELEGHEGSQGGILVSGTRRHVCKVQKAEMTAKKVKFFGGIWKGIQSACQSFGLLQEEGHFSIITGGRGGNGCKSR